MFAKKHNPYSEALAASKAKTQLKTASKHDEEVVDQDGAINPRQAGQKKASRMFAASGELNAGSKREAAQQVSYLMSESSPLRRVAGIEKRAEMAKRIAAAASDPSGEGFAVLGQELLLPIKRVVDYEGFIRKLYRVRPLAQAELFRIPTDVRASAWTIGQDGQAFESRLGVKYIQPSEFKIAAFPTVDIDELYHANYDVLDRAQDTARQEIELEEDKRGLALIDTAARAENAVTTFGTLGIASLEAQRVEIEKWGLVASTFALNRRDASDIFSIMSTHVDPVSQRELVLSGYIGNILGCKVITCAGTGVRETVPFGTVYCMTDPEYLGEMGIRIELFSEPFNKYPNKELVKGWVFAEKVGFGVANARSCSVAVRA